MSANRLTFYFNAVMLAVWIVMLPVTLLSGLKESVPYVAAISVWALIAAHFVGLIAARVAVAQESTHDKLDHIHDHVDPERDAS